jgi:anti-sigma factor RsiW
MKNDDLEFELSQLLDGDLPHDRAEAVLKRLGDDPGAAEQFRQYQAVEQALSGLSERLPDIDWDLQRDDINAELEREALLGRGASRWVGRVVRWSSMAAAAAAVLVAAVLLWPAHTQMPTTELVVAYPGAAPVAAAGPVVLSSELIVPDGLSASPERLTASLDLMAAPFVRSYEPSVLAGAPTVGTVVVSMGAPNETASPTGWLFRDLQ